MDKTCRNCKHWDNSEHIYSEYDDKNMCTEIEKSLDIHGPSLGWDSIYTKGNFGCNNFEPANKDS